MRKLALILLVICLVIPIIGCFGNTQVFTIGGYGFATRVAFDGITAVVGRFDLNLVDSDLYHEQLKIIFSQDGNNTIGQLLGVDSAKGDNTMSYSSYLNLELTPILTETPATTSE